MNMNMKSLKETIKDTLIGCGGSGMLGDVYEAEDAEQDATDLVLKAEEFAIGFANWLDKLTPANRVSVWSKDGSGRGIYTMDNEQLLERYKRMLKNGYLKQEQEQ